MAFVVALIQRLNRRSTHKASIAKKKFPIYGCCDTDEVGSIQYL
jgi:hypothetical protein